MTEVGPSVAQEKESTARYKETRYKIFAKIEWKDTSKNPTGSKNNSLSK